MGASALRAPQAHGTAPSAAPQRAAAAATSSAISSSGNTCDDAPHRDELRKGAHAGAIGVAAGGDFGNEAALCCPGDYAPRCLAAIPAELIERDSGWGDPSRHTWAGETILDLGSGGGKIAFIASQVVGPRGRVIGIDLNDQMLALARGAAPPISAQGQVVVALQEFDPMSTAPFSWTVPPVFPPTRFSR